jgi:hypothetical protein
MLVCNKNHQDHLILISKGYSDNMVAGSEVKFPSGEVKSIENCHNDVGQHHKYRM